MFECACADACKWAELYLHPVVYFCIILCSDIFSQNIMFVWSFININTQIMSKPIEIIPYWLVQCLPSSRCDLTCSGLVSNWLDTAGFLAFLFVPCSMLMILEDHTMIVDPMANNIFLDVWSLKYDLSLPILFVIHIIDYY